VVRRRRMLLIYRRSILFNLLLVSFSFLVACGHKNPLLNQGIVDTMKGKFFLRAPDFPIDKCADYYGTSKQNSSLKNICAQWSEEYYHALIRSHSIPTTTTLEDFRDPIFWQRVKQSKF
jgi:hypothetical protein